MLFVTETPHKLDTDVPPSPLMLAYNEILRRVRENDPVAVLAVPGTPITLRVLGYARDGTPVLHNEDKERPAEWKNLSAK